MLGRYYFAVPEEVLRGELPPLRDSNECPIIEYNDFLGMFQKLKDKEKPKADFTILMVHRITHGEGHPVFGDDAGL